METGNWSEIQSNLKSEIKAIFKKYKLSSLTNIEKRSIIFEYICNHVKYDFDLLQEIKEARKNNTRLPREPYLELSSAMEYRLGICNAISQYYKLLLEQVGIPAYCVICTDGTEVPHQLCLVYDSDNKSYSFDDPTSVIVKRGSKSDFFDYDTETAHSLNQGLEPLTSEIYWLILQESYIDFLIGRKSSPFKTLEGLPENINNTKKKPKLR